MLALVATAAPAASLDLSPWVSTWFKLRGTSNGVAVTGSGLRRGTERFTVYLKVWGFDASAQTLQLDAYSLEEDAGGWVGRSLDLAIIGGSAQDFVGWSVATGDLVTALAARITAKGAKATFKTLGGFSAEAATPTDDVAFAGSTVLAGKRVAPEDVPVPPGSLLH